MTGPRCEEIRELAPELALGVVEGEERGRALEHLADCPDCRRRVEELSEVADELLLLAPHREVPVGFESRALAPLQPAPKPRRRRLRLVLAPAAAAAAAVAITLAIVSGDLQLASHYRHTLDQANGREFESYALRDASGAHVGTIFSYDGSPSWVQVTMDQGDRAGLSRAELVTDDGTRVPLRWFHLDSGGGSGGSIPLDPNHVSVLRVSGAAGTQPLVARFGD
ncbi:MAG: zf-HC2 domain-containing protein [Solirubrobacterales bacterium]